MRGVPFFTLLWTNWRWNKNELLCHLPALSVKRVTSEQGHEITVMTQDKRMRGICHSCFNSGHKNALSLAWVCTRWKCHGRKAVSVEASRGFSRVYITTPTWFAPAKDLSDFSLDRRRPLASIFLDIKLKIFFFKTNYFFKETTCTQQPVLGNFSKVNGNRNRGAHITYQGKWLTSSSPPLQMLCP